MAFDKVLVANRGEIALRVMRTARRLGYSTVAVYSEADAGAPHVAYADEAVCIGPAPVGQSYLVVEKIMEAIKLTGAGAVHPGYGFLSENSAFAGACADAGVVFIGPPASAIDIMGNKRAAKLAMIEAGVPGVPGYQGEDQSDETFIAEAAKIGFPVMVKASAGGGGRGMRLVNDPKELPDALRSARSEAENSFGSGELILEKAVIEPRHVEIQIFADNHGNCLYLWERDCSVQRRHQKVIEECPSPAVDAALRKAMGEAAVKVAQACGYSGAGTVEFLLDADKNFYFLEMNTRLQVEHPVTELVTGLDLVEWQLAVAQGDELPLVQDDVMLDGHAIEARLYAEDPAAGFMPQTGKVLAFELPDEADVRVDWGVQEGQTISPHYDPMVAKVITHGRTREEACRKLSAALRDTVLLGVRNNKTFLRAIIDHPEFVAGNATTAFIGKHLADFGKDVDKPSALSRRLAALIFYFDAARASGARGEFVGWRQASRIGSTLRLTCGETSFQAVINAAGDVARGRKFDIELGALAGSKEESDEVDASEIEVTGFDEFELEYVIDGARARVPYAREYGKVYIDCDSPSQEFVNLHMFPPVSAAGAGSGRLVAPLDGAVIDVFVAEGDAVEKGQLVLVLEAMKMEHQIKADVDGTLESISVAKGDQVKTRQQLAQITPAEGGE